MPDSVLFLREGGVSVPLFIVFTCFMCPAIVLSLAVSAVSWLAPFMRWPARAIALAASSGSAFQAIIGFIAWIYRRHHLLESLVLVPPDAHERYLRYGSQIAALPLWWGLGFTMMMLSPSLLSLVIAAFVRARAVPASG